MSPRCGRPMLRFEAVWGPLLEDPVCGRPEGHNGVCRSTLALAKALEGDRKRWPRVRDRYQARRREWDRAYRRSGRRVMAGERSRAA